MWELDGESSGDHDYYYCSVYDYYYCSVYDDYDYSSGVSVFGGLVVGWGVLSAAVEAYDYYVDFVSASVAGELVGCVCVYVAGGGHDCGWWVV